MSQELAIETFTIETNDREFSFIKPADPTALLDEVLDQGFDEDEFLPYWADHWPSAEIAIEKLPQLIPSSHSVLEIGAGLGIFATILASYGHKVVASDYAVDSCDFMKQNAIANEVAVEVLSFDWRAPVFNRQFDTLVGIDILYESRWTPPVINLLTSLLKTGGKAYILDPCRQFLPGFINAVETEPQLTIKQKMLDKTKAGITITTLEIERL